MKASKLSIEDVMGRIKDAILLNTDKSGLETSPGPNSLVGHSEVTNMIRHLTTENYEKYCLAIEPPITSHRKILGPLIIFGKKTAIKLFSWYTTPLIERQM